MEISVWLTNGEVKCLNFSEKQKTALEAGIENARVSLHASSASFKESLPNAEIALVWVFKNE